MVFNLMVALITPPARTVLYAPQKVTDIPFERIVKSMIPFYLPLITTLIITVIFSSLSLCFCLIY